MFRVVSANVGNSSIMNTKIHSLRWLHILIIVAVCGVGFISQFGIAYAATNVVQVDANGNTYDPANSSNPRLLAGSSLSVYVKVTNSGSATLSSVAVSVGGTICPGVSSTVINTGFADISSGASKIYQIQIVSAATVTNSSCNTITVADTTPSPSSVVLQFNIGPAPSATATAVATATPSGLAPPPRPPPIASEPGYPVTPAESQSDVGSYSYSESESERRAATASSSERD